MRHMNDETNLDPVAQAARSRSPSLADDLLYGAGAIAEFLGIPSKIASNKLTARLIPAGKEGKVWVASRSNLKEHYRRLTLGTVNR